MMFLFYKTTHTKNVKQHFTTHTKNTQHQRVPSLVIVCILSAFILPILC